MVIVSEKMKQIVIHCPRGRTQLPDAKKLEELFAWALTFSLKKYRPMPHMKPLLVDLSILSDDEIGELNARFMKKRESTDVLSFPMGEYDPERCGFHLGEIFVSCETAQREAAARKIRFKEELSRYCVHGFLHLLGYEDSTPELRKKMFAVQERALKAAGFTTR